MKSFRANIHMTQSIPILSRHTGPHVCSGKFRLCHLPRHSGTKCTQSHPPTPRLRPCPMFSRHYADVAKIEPYVNLHATQHMFADIVAHQSKYTTRDTNAQIQTTADVNLVSSPETMARLGNDFANMRPQFHKQPPQWTDIVNKLQIINNNIKSINR